VKPAAELRAILQQRTWDKEVVVWLGSEQSLLETVNTAHLVALDLLDLFDDNSLPADDVDTRTLLTRQLRGKLQSLPKGPDARSVLVVKSIGLLARYNMGLKEFHDWFVGSYAMVILLLEKTASDTLWPEEVELEAGRLLHYFVAAGLVKEVYEG
jgi:hypothetical protein